MMTNTYSCREFRKTLDVYSNKRDVFERLRATLFGLEKANAVPTDDWLSAPAPVSKRRKKFLVMSFPLYRSVTKNQ